MHPSKDAIAATACSMAGCNHPKTTLKPVSEHALMLQVTVTACNDVAGDSDSMQ